MKERQRRYWGIRTDKNNINLLLNELYAGRLRQGWGYNSSQDLRIVQDEIYRGGQWWERLNQEQKYVLGHLRILSSSKDSVKIGDWILLPNLPTYGPFFLIAEVVGDYYFEMLPLSGETDVNDLGQDYGHILPVRLVIENEINKYAEYVDASIRTTLRTPKRMWNIDGLGDAINHIVQQYEAGADFSTATSGAARLQTAWEIAWSETATAFQQRLGDELDIRFQAAEWEEPIRIALTGLYPGADVRWVAGPNERGADVIVQLKNHFGAQDWLIVIQIKNYTGEIGSAVLEQLQQAYLGYSTEGKILSLVVMTTAEKISENATKSVSALMKKLDTPIEFVLRQEMMRILSDGLMARMRDVRDVIG